MKNLKEKIGKQTCNYPHCRAVPQPTVPPINRLSFLVNYRVASPLFWLTWSTMSWPCKCQIVMQMAHVY